MYTIKFIVFMYTIKFIVFMYIYYKIYSMAIVSGCSLVE